MPKTDNRTVLKAHSTIDISPSISGKMFAAELVSPLGVVGSQSSTDGLDARPAYINHHVFIHGIIKDSSSEHFTMPIMQLLWLRRPASLTFTKQEQFSYTGDAQLSQVLDAALNGGYSIKKIGRAFTPKPSDLVVDQIEDAVDDEVSMYIKRVVQVPQNIIQWINRELASPGTAEEINLVLCGLMPANACDLDIQIYTELEFAVLPRKFHLR